MQSDASWLQARRTEGALGVLQKVLHNPSPKGSERSTAQGPWSHTSSSAMGYFQQVFPAQERVQTAKKSDVSWSSVTRGDGKVQSQG